jgi:hypothetical protein
MDGLPRVEGVTKRINQFLSGQPCGKLLATRDFLGFGKRGAVDTALGRLVKKKLLARAARGVFYKPDPNETFAFTAVEIALVKARAFGKEVIEFPQAKGTTKIEELNFEQKLVASTGSKSDFRVRGTQMLLNGRAHRKVRLGDTKVGTLALAYWRAGKKLARGQALTDSLLQGLTPTQINHLCAQFRLLPAWMNDCLAMPRLQALQAAP